MKTIEVAYSLSLALVLVLICCFVYASYRFVEATIATIPYEALLLLGLTCCASAGAVVSGGALFILRWLSARSRRVYAKNALYPHIENGKGGYVNLNEAGAQSIAALSSCKPSAGTVGKIAEMCRQIGSYDPAMIPGPASPSEQPAQLTVDDVMAFDPKVSPHWLLIGSTGSGKTSASYQILSQLSQLHSCEFVIAEPGGVNWGLQATATETAEIARVVIEAKEEMERRQTLLRDHDVDHISALPSPLPYIVLVSEETDSVFDELRLTDRELRKNAIVALRAIARMGRKAGVCIVAISQSGTVDVFDSHVRKNLGNVLLFRSEHTVANSWQVGERLNNLPAGTAYSVTHGGLVKFGLSRRPQLIKKYSCAAENEGDAVALAEPVATVAGPFMTQLQRLERGCEPDEQLAEQLRMLHRSGRSKTSLCNDVWGYKDGKVFEILNRVLGFGGEE